MKAILALLVACDAGLEPVGPMPPGQIDTHAVVRIAGEQEECSNLGGRHYAFEVDEPAHRRVQFGGHGQAPIDAFYTATDDVVSAAHVKPEHRYYVARIRFEPFDEADQGWCIAGSHFDGVVLDLEPATGLAEARAQLAIEYGWPWPGPSSNRTSPSPRS